MHLARVAGLLIVSIATLGQEQSVEITSEPSHHLVLENAYVRVFDVTVAPKASTLVHRHHNDYLFVTLGDSDVISARPGEKPAALLLKDGEIRFTPGKFEHAAINQSDKPFHNITIELLKPATHVTSIEKQITSDQWRMSLRQLPPSIELQKQDRNSNMLVIAVSDLELQQQSDGATKQLKLAPGGLLWLPAGDTQILKNNTADAARYVTLEFPAEKQ